MAAVKKTIMLFLVMFITMTTMFHSSEAGFDSFPDSYFNRFGDGFGPHRYPLCQTIQFTYCDNNMIRVRHDDFSACNPSNPISALVDNIFTFEEYGDYYFICSDPWRCDDLDKDYIRIGSYEPTPPTTAPVPSPATAPVPSPASGLVPSQASAPATAPYMFG